MDTQATPEFIISPMRVQTLPEITFFYITSPPIPFADLDKHLAMTLTRRLFYGGKGGSDNLSSTQYLFE